MLQNDSELGEQKCGVLTSSSNFFTSHDVGAFNHAGLVVLGGNNAELVSNTVHPALLHRRVRVARAAPKVL
jgi:hypothetical protein